MRGFLRNIWSSFWNYLQETRIYWFFGISTIIYIPWRLGNVIIPLDVAILMWIICLVIQNIANKRTMTQTMNIVIEDRNEKEER